MEAVERNWAELPTDVLHLIAKKLPDISDFIHARAICKPWRSSISASDLPPQFPWILNLGKEPDRYDNPGPDLQFFSMASNKVFTIHAPNFSDKILFGPARGYLLAESVNRDRLSLLDPLNSSEVCLPDLDGYRFLSWCDQQWSRCFQNCNCVVVVDCFNRLVVCKRGDDKWDIVGGDWVNGFSHLKNLLFLAAEHDFGVTRVLDIGSHEEVYVIPRPKDEKFPSHPAYLVESCGEILRVCCSHSWDHHNELPEYLLDTNSFNMAGCEFDIHRLDFGNGKGHPCWVKVRGIGDQMLFLDFTAGRGFSLATTNFAGSKGNCIYFIDKFNQIEKIRRDNMTLCRNKGEVSVVYMHDIENGSTVSIDCPFDSETDITWFVPTLNHI